MHDGITRCLLTLIMVTLVGQLAVSCVPSHPKQMATDMVLNKVEQETPLTQRDINLFRTMLSIKSGITGLTNTRNLYVIGKTVMGLTQNLNSAKDLIVQPKGGNQLLGSSRLDFDGILGRLDKAGLIDKKMYKDLQAMDKDIFKPSEQEAQLIEENRKDLISSLIDSGI